MKRIAVVGGGISGLATGLELRRAGADVVVFEAADRPGGVIGSVRVAGRILELGPQRLRLTQAVRSLVAELGLEDRLLTAPELPLYVFADGRLREVPRSWRAAFSTDLLRWRDRLRVLTEPLRPGLRDDESAGDFFTRKLGPALYRRLAGPLYGGLYGSDPAEMPARHGLRATLDLLGVRRSLLLAFLRASGSPPVPACSFRDGLQTLTDAMAQRLGGRLRPGTTAGPVRRDAGRFRVVAGDDDVRADAVVVATGAGAAADLLAEIAPDAARGLRSLRYNSIALVHLASGADLHGLGYQVALGEDLATRGVTWNHALFGRRGLYTAFLGGAARPDVVDLPDGELGAVAAAEFETVTGHGAAVLHVHRTRMPAWDRSWGALDGLALPAGVRVSASWASRPGVLGRLADARRLAAELTAGDPFPAAGESAEP